MRAPWLFLLISSRQKGKNTRRNKDIYHVQFRDREKGEKIVREKKIKDRKQANGACERSQWAKTIPFCDQIILNVSFIKKIQIRAEWSCQENVRRTKSSWWKVACTVWYTQVLFIREIKHTGKPCKRESSLSKYISQERRHRFPVSLSIKRGPLTRQFITATTVLCAHTSRHITCLRSSNKLA